jgi:hypothetical protein
MAYDRVDGVNLRMSNQFIHRGVTLQLDRDLVARIGHNLTYSQAVEYQVIRDQDVAMTRYLQDTSGAWDPSAGTGSSGPQETA